MNINEEIFRSLYLELDNNKEALNTSSLLFDKAVNGTMDSRLKIGVINGKISSIETSFIKLKKENSENIDLSMNVKRYFDDLSNVLNMKIGTLSGEIPFSMYNDRDGISWIEKNMNKIEEQKANKATEFNNENIDIDALLEYYPDFKNYLEKFEKEYPFLKKLSAEGKKKLYEEAYYIYLTSQLNSNYYVNRDEILEIKKEQESLNISFSAISNVDAQSWSKEYKEKVKTTITGEGFDFIEYHQRYEYLVNKNYNDLTKEEMVEYDALDENINYIGEIAFKIKKNEDKLKAYGINSISIVNELESAYQSIKQTESSFVYGYIKYTNDFDEFVESRNNDYDYSFKHNGFREYSKYVNDDQRKIFDYLSINYGRESAENYYKSNLEEDFIIAKGVDEAYSYLEKINDENVFLQSGITAWEGLQDGFEGYFRNVGNMFAPTKKISSDDVKIQLIMKAFEGKILTDTLGEDRAKEVLEKLEKGEYTKDDIIKILNNEGKDYNSVLDGYVFNDENIKNSILKNMYTTSMVVGNMLPAMIAGKISAVVLKTTAFANLPVGTILTGISSGGSARNNALIDGYSEGEALAYSLVTGATTGLLEYYLSPFEGIGKNSVKFDSKTIMGVFRKFGLSAVSNVTEEIIEDSVQTLLIDNIMLGKTVTVDEFLDSSWETIKTAIMVSAFMGVPSITLNLGKIGSEKIANIKINSENMSKIADIFKIEDRTLRNQKLIELGGAFGIVAPGFELPNQNTEKLANTLRNLSKSFVLKFEGLFKNSDSSSYDIKDIVDSFNQMSQIDQINYIKNSDASIISGLFTDSNIYKKYSFEIDSKIIEFQDIFFGITNIVKNVESIINNENILNNLSNSNLLILISKSRKNVNELVIKEVEKRISNEVDLFSTAQKTTDPWVATYNSLYNSLKNLPLELSKRIKEFYTNKPVHSVVASLVEKYPKFDIYQQHFLSRLIKEGKIDSTGINALNRLFEQHPGNLDTFNFEILDSRVINALGEEYVLDVGKYDYISFNLMSIFNNQNLFDSFSKLITKLKTDNSLKTFSLKNRKLINFFFLNQVQLSELNSNVILDSAFVNYVLKFYKGNLSTLNYVDIDFTLDFEKEYAKKADETFIKAYNDFINTITKLKSKEYIEQKREELIEHYKSMGYSDIQLNKFIDAINQNVQKLTDLDIKSYEGIASIELLSKLKNLYFQKYFSITQKEAEIFVKKYGNDLNQISGNLAYKSILSVIDTMKKVINLDNVEEIVKIYNNQLFSFNSEEMLYIDDVASNAYTTSYEQQLKDTNRNLKTNMEVGNSRLVNYNGNSVVVVDAPESFSFFVHSSDTGYVVNKELINDSFIETWNVDHNPKTHGLSTSFITQSNIGSAPVLGNGVLYAFSEVAAENIFGMGTTDINGNIADYGFSSGKDQEYYSPQNISQETVRIYNEFVIDRSSSKPNYIILYTDSTETGKQNAYKAASEWNIPIVEIDKIKLASSQRGIIDDIVEIFDETKDVKTIESALKLYEANATGYGLNSKPINESTTLENGVVKEEISQIFDPTKINTSIESFIQESINSKNPENLEGLIEVLEEMNAKYERANEFRNTQLPNSNPLIDYNKYINEINNILGGV